jgi:hypothetical protein
LVRISTPMTISAPNTPLLLGSNSNTPFMDGSP